MAILLCARVLDSVEAHVSHSPLISSLTLEVPAADGGHQVFRNSVKALRDIMLNADTPADLRDGIWSRLLQLAREKTDPWDVITIWMMTPGLRKICWRCRSHGVQFDLAELEAEAVSTFLATARVADLDRPDLGRTLWRNTYRHVRRTVSRPRPETPTADIELVRALDASPFDASRAIAAFQRLVGDGTLAMDKSSGDVDPVTIEGERLGAVAQRLGLKLARDQADRHGDGKAA
ncbi:hypothetical protein ND748_00155 [Frankia sp. AiPs1]|uniref:hypothetical protein n=1 Tax=Frankia sp. AiPs1 TaxID=573493 RepID=UPI0020432008|nr:hypothetical protein [Frankia sp. AiPs1]MCM3920110.1 hypothetical protein [Frankia sp. AiPs1]